MIWLRHGVRVALVPLLLTACSRANPDFGDLDAATDGQPTSGTPPKTTGSTTPPVASGSTSGSTSMSPGTAATSSPPATSTTDASASSDDVSADTGVLWDLGEPGSQVTLFTSIPVRGDFGAFSGGWEAGGPQICAATVEMQQLTIDCDNVVPILGATQRPLPALVDDYPKLPGATFVDLTGQKLADDYLSIVNGVVASDFANRVTENLGGVDEALFWWGHTTPGDQACEAWTEVAASGTARLFAPMRAINITEACVEELSLLCACIPP